MNRTARRLVPVFAAACACLAGPAGALTFHTYKTAVGGELISTLPGDNTNRVLYSLPVSTISAGDVLVVDNEFEMENDGLATAMLTAHVILADSPGATTGTDLGVETTQGISALMFRNKRFKGAIKQFASALSLSLIHI